MFFRQVLYRDLGCASYILGDGGEALVVDPRWDVDVYLETAAAEGLRITHVIDTHEHADHVSGRLALVQATGARAHRSATIEDGATSRPRALVRCTSRSSSCSRSATTSSCGPPTSAARCVEGRG